MRSCVADVRHCFQDEIAAVTSALPAPEPGAEVDEFEGRLQHALEALTMEVPPLKLILTWIHTYMQHARQRTEALAGLIRQRCVRWVLHVTAQDAALE